MRQPPFHTRGLLWGQLLLLSLHALVPSHGDEVISSKGHFSGRSFSDHCIIIAFLIVFSQDPVSAVGRVGGASGDWTWSLDIPGL